MKDLLISFFDKSFWQTVFVSLVSVLITYFSVWYKRNNYFHLYFWRRLRSWITKRKYIIVWNDHTIGISEKIIAHLKQENPGYRYKSLEEPDELLNYPLSPKYVHMVLVIVSDVTKLSESEAKRERIQTKLEKYVIRGGTLFGTHDIIYRRLRNKILEKIYGCEICNFKRVSAPIPGVVLENAKDHPLLRGLPSEMAFDDGELCWGDWSKDARVLIVSKSKHKNNHNSSTVHVPMVVVNSLGNFGTLIWINSGDKNEKLCRSLSEPQQEVLQLFSNAIEFSDEIKSWGR